jgi:hypothetical protein
MALLFIDFEWWKDAKGYRLVAPERARPAESTSVLQSVGKPQRVVPNGGESRAYRPLDKFDTLYMAFAHVRTAENLLHFIEYYGPLTAHGLQPDRGDRVSFVLENAEMFRAWLDANDKTPKRTHGVDWQRGQKDDRRRKELAAWIGKEGKRIGSLEASLTADTSGVLSFRVRPKTLLTALWLQLAQALSGGKKISACLHCGEWFEAGPDTDKRFDAKFCSDEHRIAFNSLKRSREN